MERFKKYLPIAGFVLALLLASFLLGRCSTKEERKTSISNLIAARDSVKKYSVIINGLKNSVWEKNAIILGQEQSIQAGIVERELLKKLHIKDLITNTELSGIIKKQDSLLALPPKTEFITIKDSSGIKNNYVRYPFQLLNVHTEFLDLDAGLDSAKLAWYKHKIPFSGTVSVGYKKTGLFKASPVGIFTSTNPDLQVQKMDVLIVKEQEKYYQKTWFKMLAGAAIFETGRHLLFK